MTTLALIAVGIAVCRRALSGVWEHGRRDAEKD